MKKYFNILLALTISTAAIGGNSSPSAPERLVVQSQAVRLAGLLDWNPNLETMELPKFDRSLGKLLSAEVTFSGIEINNTFAFVRPIGPETPILIKNRLDVFGPLKWSRRNRRLYADRAALSVENQDAFSALPGIIYQNVNIKLNQALRYSGEKGKKNLKLFIGNKGERVVFSFGSSSELNFLNRIYKPATALPANNWATLPPFFFYVADAKITGQVAYTYLAKRKKDDRDENEGNSDDDDADCEQDGVRQSGSEGKWQYIKPLPR